MVDDQKNVLNRLQSSCGMGINKYSQPNQKGD